LVTPVSGHAGVCEVALRIFFSNPSVGLFLEVEIGSTGDKSAHGLGFAGIRRDDHGDDS